MSKTPRFVFLVLAFSLLQATLSAEETATCYKLQGNVCSTDSSCIHLPSSNLLQSTQPRIGFDGGLINGKCGTKIPNLTSCGVNTWIHHCTNEGGDNSCECGPGTGEPCQAFVPPGDLEAAFFGDTPPPLIPKSTFPAMSARTRPDLEKRHMSLGPAQHSALEHLRNLFTEPSLYMKASVQITVSSSGEAAGQGSYEYWSSGAMYRTRSHASPELGLPSSSQTAYNLVQYQHLTQADAYLRLSDDYFGTLQPVPNPLFAAIPFFALPYDDSCGLCTPSPQDLQDPARWSEVLAQGAARKDGSILLAGGKIDDRPYIFRLQVSPHGHIDLVEAVFLDGEVFSSTRLSYHSAVAGTKTKFPTDIVLTYFEDGRESISYEYQIHNLRANESLPDQIFTLDPIQADLVVDITAQSILKHHQISKEEWHPEFQ